MVPIEPWRSSTPFFGAVAFYTTKIDDLKTTWPCQSHIQRLHYRAFAAFFYHFPSFDALCVLLKVCRNLFVPSSLAPILRFKILVHSNSGPWLPHYGTGPLLVKMCELCLQCNRPTLHFSKLIYLYFFTTFLPFLACS